jgi:L-alanine-DL-glutamate epimerase-like enolase superfamily enzyme
MKVTHVAVDLLQVPVERSYTAAGRQVGANWHVLARVTTADGIQGSGYIVYPRGDLMAAIAQATRELGEQLIGCQVMEVEAAWQRLARYGNWVGPGGLLHCAMAPLDIALWDVAGKTVGQPVYRLLGGYRDRLPAYASDALWYSLSLDELAASARQHASQGFQGVKLRLGKEARAEDEVRRVQTVREAVGSDMRIMVDATESWDLSQAMRTGHALQDAGVVWLEDPVQHQDLEGLAQLARALEMPVAAGEHLYQLADFQRLLQARAVDVVILDLARVGGITPWRRIAALAQACQTPVCGHVVPEVHVHLLASVPNGHLVEYMPRSAAILRSMPTLEDGSLVVPQAPGLGIELDEVAVRRYRVA